MSKELKAFEKICKNLNSYEFTDEYKKNKKLIETALNEKINIENHLDNIFSKYHIRSFIELETALKNYQELLEKPCVLVGRNNGHTKALIDVISKNYKEIKITNLDDEKKLEALEIIKKKEVNVARLVICKSAKEYNARMPLDSHLTQEEFDLLKEVLK